MKFCMSHWDRLKQAIKSRGLFDLVSSSGQEVLERTQEELQGKRITLENFDPLMGAHWSIANNAMELVKKLGGNPLAILMASPEHPEWECPICYLNWISAEHDRVCTDPECKKPRGLTFDDWIDKAADGMVEVSRTIPGWGLKDFSGE